MKSEAGDLEQFNVAFSMCLAGPTQFNGVEFELFGLVEDECRLDRQRGGEAQGLD